MRVIKKGKEPKSLTKYKKQKKDIYMVALRDENGQLIGYYEKHEYRNPEMAKMYDFSCSL